MKRPKDFLGKTHGFLKQSPVFSSFPFSLVLIGFEEMMEKLVFVCPCKDEQNINLTVSMFTGPALFILALMNFVLRPFKHGCSHWCAGVNDDTQQNTANAHQTPDAPQNFPKAFASCLIPPVMWIFILLLDGDYVACGKTGWKGVYVFDEELNRSWCKPTEGFRNETELRHLTQKYVHGSQFAGYVMIGVLGALSFILVVVFDSCITGKCDSCQSQLLSFCGRTAERQNEGQGPATATMGQDQQAGSSATTGPHESGRSATTGQQGSGSSAIAGERPEESGGSAAAEQGQQGLESSATMELKKLLPKPHQPSG